VLRPSQLGERVGHHHRIHPHIRARQSLLDRSNSRPSRTPPPNHMVMATNRSGLSQLKPAGVFGRTPAIAVNPTDRQLLPGQKVGKKPSWSPPRSPERRSSSEGLRAGDSGGRKISKNGRNQIRRGLAHDSELAGETGSSSEEGGGEEKEDEEDVHARSAVVGEQVAGRGAGTGGKRRGVGAMFRRRLRSVKGAHKDVLSAAAAAAAAAASRQPKRGDRPQAFGERGARDRDSSSCSSSSSSSSSSSQRLQSPAPPDVVMRTPAGVWMNRSSKGLVGGRERQHGVAGAYADANPGVPGGGGGAGQSGGAAGRGEDTLLGQSGRGQEHANGSDVEPEHGLQPY